jgi:hypothetical protein
MKLTETFQFRNPSEILCPATVATREALWPDASKASAKSNAAPITKDLRSLQDPKDTTYLGQSNC